MFEWDVRILCHVKCQPTLEWLGISLASAGRRLLTCDPLTILEPKALALVESCCPLLVDLGSYNFDSFRRRDCCRFRLQKAVPGPSEPYDDAYENVIASRWKCV